MSSNTHDAKGRKPDRVSPVREKALEIIYQINNRGAYANLALEKGLEGSELSLSDRNQVTEMVNGTIRMQKHLDWVLALFLQGEPAHQNAWFINILRLAVYQLLFMERIPAYACVNDAVTLTHRRVNRSMARATNAILRRLLREEDSLSYPPPDFPEFLAVYYSHPDWMVHQMLTELGAEETRRILEYNNLRPRLEFRCNRLKANRDEVMKRLGEEKVCCAPSDLVPEAILIESLPCPIGDLQAYRDGLFYVQNQASMLTASLLNPQPGETVIDLCAGLGGKTTHLAEWMDNRGLIYAYDLYAKKLHLLEQNASRLGITIIRSAAENVLHLTSDHAGAQRILLDAPCSGLGVLNRRADSRWHKKPEDVAALQKTQRGLLDQAARLVKKGGRILYSTCSVLGSENQDQVVEFLHRHPQFVLEPLTERLRFFPLDPADTRQAEQGMLLISPGKYGTDGMFYAVLRRTV